MGHKYTHPMATMDRGVPHHGNNRGGEGRGEPDSNNTDSEEVLNLEYLKSTPAILKITQLVFLLSAFLLVHTSGFAVLYVYMAFQIITLTVFFLTFLFLCAATFNLPKRISPSCGPVTECALDIVALVYVFSASCAAAVRSYDVPVLVAASILGLVVSFLMAASVSISVKPVYSMLYSKIAPHIAAEV